MSDCPLIICDEIVTVSSNDNSRGFFSKMKLRYLLCSTTSSFRDNSNNNRTLAASLNIVCSIRKASSERLNYANQKRDQILD
ncbi:unnamed protein product [Trichobilharzia regenti]|nr:unnamed protein product [Trichobilharzia regenti]